MSLTIGSLFSGIGGLELGLEWAGLGPVVWQVEKDPYCRAVLAKHWPDTERYEDVRYVGARNLAGVDVICGGFPCQDVSVAGKGAGLAGERSGLWSEFARVIRELRPRIVVVENVAALLARGFGDVLGDLAGLGFDAEWSCVSAASVGAPHLRNRVFLVAYARCGRDDERANRREASRAREQSVFADTADGRERLGDAHRERQRLVGQSKRAELESAFRREPDGPIARMGDADRGRREQRDAGAGNDSESDPRHVSMVDAASGGWRARSKLGIRRTERGCASVGDTSGARRGECDASAFADRPRHPSGQCAGVVGWSDAGPARGFDGTVRTLPREAIEAGPQSALWPVADGLPGRVARLRAIGNAVVPQVAEVVGKVVLALEAEFTRGLPRAVQKAMKSKRANS